MDKNPFLHNDHLPGDEFFWEGNNTGILLSHGYTATTAEVRPLAETLYRQGYTVAGPLLPGHGTDPKDMCRCQVAGLGRGNGRGVSEIVQTL